MYKKNQEHRLIVSNNTGAALIITLLLMTLITGLVVEFVYEVYIGTSSLANWRDAQKASLIAKSGQSITSNYIKGIKELSFTYYDELILPVELDFGPDTKLTVKVEDENAKFNINSIIYENGQDNDKEALPSFKRLLEYLKINPELADLIADWIDPDTIPRIGDSETNAKNSSLWDINEIKYIKGIDDEIFKKVSPYITVYGNRLNTPININTAQLPVLISLDKAITEDFAEKIINYRESSPFESKEDIIGLSESNPLVAIKHRLTVKSSYFRVTARAEVNGTTRVIESVIDTSMNIHLWREG
jgi:general secretion pathway protein K